MNWRALAILLIGVHKAYLVDFAHFVECEPSPIRVIQCSLLFATQDVRSRPNSAPQCQQSDNTQPAQLLPSHPKCALKGHAPPCASPPPSAQRTVDNKGRRP